MNKYLILSVLILIGINVAGFFYFSAKLDSKDSDIKLEQERVTTLTNDKTKLEAEVAKLIKVTAVKDVEYEKAILAFEDYKDKVGNLTAISAPSIKPIIKEVPAEVVVIKANETSNEILNRINTGADEFKRLPN